MERFALTPDQAKALITAIDYTLSTQKPLRELLERLGQPDELLGPPLPDNLLDAWQRLLREAKINLTMTAVEA